MKISNFDDHVHILDDKTDVWSVIRNITDSGLQEEAFYVLNIGDIVKKYEEWVAYLPTVKPYYAVKCNDSLTVLEVLAALGTNFDCASKTEINKVLSIGVDPSRIIFANPARPASHIRHAAANDVNVLTFDSETELHKIRTLCPRAKMVLRLRCDAVDTQCPLGIKFGCDPISEAPRLLQIARSLDIDVIGVSFHVGSGCREPTAYKRAIATCRDVFDYAAKLGYDFKLLDIGGGFPGHKDTSIKELAHVINTSLADHFPDPSIRVIAEPGRYFVAAAYTLVCNIYSIRDVMSNDCTARHRMYYINDGIYGSFNCLLYDHQKVVPLVLHERPGVKTYSSSLWGPTCDSLDVIVDDIRLPEMQIGDWLVFENMGAYTLPVASPFNGFPVPKVHVVAQKGVWEELKGCISEGDFVMGSSINHNNNYEFGGEKTQPAVLHRQFDEEGGGVFDLIGYLH